MPEVANLPYFREVLAAWAPKLHWQRVIAVSVMPLEKLQNIHYLSVFIN